MVLMVLIVLMVLMIFFLSYNFVLYVSVTNLRKNQFQMKILINFLK